MSALPRVAILDYGMGNIRSVSKAVERSGGEPDLTSDEKRALDADALVVPGVGAFGACMAGLRDAGLDRVVADFAESGKPLLGVCLGMQVLFERSEEGDVRGLGLLKGSVVKLASEVKVPHMGWNEVTWSSSRHPLTEGLGDGDRFYFVHSYVCEPEDGVTAGRTEHGREFAAAVARDNLFGTQFHPEKSGDAGLRIYRNLVEAAA